MQLIVAFRSFANAPNIFFKYVTWSVEVLKANAEYKILHALLHLHGVLFGSRNKSESRVFRKSTKSSTLIPSVL
jgi:hypothetical protein